MGRVETGTILLQVEEKAFVNYRSEYNVNLWREFKRRWMVFGVLISVTLAVLSPRLGAPGGNYPACSQLDHPRTHCTSLKHALQWILYRRFPTIETYYQYDYYCWRSDIIGVLRMEIVQCAAMWSVYYLTGRGTRLRGAGGVRDLRGRLCVLAILHAHAAAPVLAAVSALALKDVTLDRRLLEGSLVTRSRGPCGWLSLALCSDSSPAAPLLAALNYTISLVALPLALLFFCGHTFLPPLSGVVWTVATTATPFLLGCTRPYRRSHHFTSKLLALLLLYIDCCSLLRESEGSLYVTDVLATLFLEVSSVSLLAACSSLYAHYGLLQHCECHALALASVPKATGLGWEMHTACMSSGLARLPSVFHAPAQALLMAAMYGDEDEAQICEESPVGDD